jgi:hypothetical protein
MLGDEHNRNLVVTPAFFVSTTSRCNTLFMIAAYGVCADAARARLPWRFAQ